MADWSYVQPFDGLNDGDLNGQDSWSGDVAYDVQTTVKFAGAKAVSCSPASLTENFIHRSLPASVDGGSLIFYMAATKTSGEAGNVWLMQGINRCVRIQFTGGNININTSSNTTVLTGFVSGQWYKIQVDFLSSTTFNITIDDGTANGPFTYVSETSFPDRIQFSCYDTGTVYWDEISLPVVASTAHNLSLLGCG